MNHIFFFFLVDDEKYVFKIFLLGMKFGRKMLPLSRVYNQRRKEKLYFSEVEIFVRNKLSKYGI